MFRVPVFPLVVNIWNGGIQPPAPPSLVTVGNLCLPHRDSQVVQDYAPGLYVDYQLYVLLPAGTDVRDGSAGFGNSFLEIPAGTFRLYQAVFVDDVAKGFSNEYRRATIVKLPGWSVGVVPYH